MVSSMFVPVLGWRVHFTCRGLPRPRITPPLLCVVGDLDEWLDGHGVAEGQPFLLDPLGRYDVELNHYFEVELVADAVNSQVAAAYDLKRFLAFLWENRGGRSWRDATAADRAAYRRWRLVDGEGPRVELVTWDREVATVNRFYRWAVRMGHVQQSPFVQRDVRHQLSHRSGATETPAEASHLGPRRDVRWLTPAMYRRWRDVGVRGLQADGLPDPSFRGRYASRNAAYTDLLIRTGLRLSEQTSLSLFEVPRPSTATGHARSWLPASIAKGGSARHIYFPESVLRDVWDYVEVERADAVERGRHDEIYEQIRDPLIMEDPTRPWVLIGGQRVKVSSLNAEERLRLLVATPAGLEPASLWLNESGQPSRPAGWQQMFKNANARCATQGVRLSCHPHMLRHSFAVITLEQLWRGHIKELAGMVPAQRQTYQMVFGDPLNWVRMRMGHRSIVTTQVYLHTLQELEMQTRMALIPDEWEAPVAPHDDAPAAVVG